MSTLKIKRENGKIFCPLADSWHIETPEEKVRQEYIKILVENYGYSLDQMAQEIKVNNSQRGQGKARADIVIWKSKQDKIESKAAFIVVECKAENVLRTCHNIIRNNDKLSPEAAFDEISKILFMKIKYEREQRGAKVFTKNEFVRLPSTWVSSSLLSVDCIASMRSLITTCSFSDSES